MKLAIAAFSTALVLATSASAMIGPYERAVIDPTVENGLFTRGEQKTVETKEVASPAYSWNAGQPQEVTVFSTSSPDNQGNDGFYNLEGR
ncbi:hypothetical protein LZG00_14880 [Rhodobacteraceae bacterium LMO-12]|nr:hypothetical protein [Rhodobacteraceae bacterium LMO-JJ12]